MISTSLHPRREQSVQELAPDLPMSVFTSTAAWNEERIGALALYCSDGRWGLAFDEFCHKSLQIPRYDRWAVPGGPAWLATADQDEAFTQAARQQLDFLVQIHGLERIVLITHYGCAVYAQGLGKTPQECLPAQIEDLRIAARSLRNSYSEIRVEGYLAMRLERSISFHELHV